jgi:hypothetical protein
LTPADWLYEVRSIHLRFDEGGLQGAPTLGTSSARVKDPGRGSAPIAVAVPSGREHPYNDFVTDDSPDAVAARLRTALDLCELGESMRRAQLHREHPDATDEEIETLLVAWLQTRPGAEHGDGWGRPVSWPPPRP